MKLSEILLRRLFWFSSRVEAFTYAFQSFLRAYQEVRDENDRKTSQDSMFQTDDDRKRIVGIR